MYRKQQMFKNVSINHPITTCDFEQSSSKDLSMDTSDM